MDEIDTADSRWIESVTDCSVERSEPLVGGTSSLLHRCWLSDGTTVVLRHIVDREWLDREPYLIDSEASSLALFAGSEVPVPKHLASDPASGRLLMSWMPGRLRPDADHLRRSTEPMAEMAARIAAAALPPDHSFPKWRPWTPTEPEPPEWGDSALWQMGIDAYIQGGPPKSETELLLHRDFHPLNLLWDESGIVAVLDWVNACVGHPHAELSHCRWNLSLLADIETADRFLAHYLALTDHGPYAPWWDLSTALGFLPGPVRNAAWHAVGRTDLTAGKVVEATETFLRSALNRL